MATIDIEELLAVAVVEGSAVAVAVVEGSAVAAFPRCSDCWLSTPIWPPAQARLGRRVAFDRPPVVTSLPGDLRPVAPSSSSARACNAQVHPLLLREVLELPSSGSVGWFLALAYADLHVKPYAKRQVKVYLDTRAPVAAAAS